MNVHVLQHVPFEDIGSMADWLAARHARLGYTRFYEADARLPTPDAPDLLVIMGGPMSVNDEDTLPWLVEEKRFIAEVIQRGTPVIGICLGAQLIASALGARIYPGRHREIGWFDVASTVVGEGVFRFPERQSIFHWHGETFDLPPGATLLASSAACAHQAFQWGERVIGLQCHPEVTPDSLAAMLTGCADELSPSPWVQAADEIRNTPAAYFTASRTLMDALLAYVMR